LPVTWQVISYPVADGATPESAATFLTATTHAILSLGLRDELGDGVSDPGERRMLPGGQQNVDNVLHGLIGLYILNRTFRLRVRI